MSQRQRKFATRRSANEIPLGWTHVDRPAHLADTDRHTWYRCPHVQYALGPQGMELRRCSCICRKDQIKDHERARKGHVFDIPQSEDPLFPTTLTENLRLRILEKVQDLVLEQVAQAVIKLHISLNKASSDNLWRFCIEMIRIGQKVAEEHVDPDQALIPFSRKVLTERVLQIGERLKLRDIEAAHELRFVNIAVDAGTVLGKSVVHALLTNPYSEEFPVILEVCDNDGFDKAKYKQLFALLLMKCLHENLTICSIITDGLRAQRSGLEELIAESEDSDVCSIIPLHCLAHVTQLVFTDTIKQSTYLRTVLAQVHELATLLRTGRVVREMGEKCPSVCQTRWLYIVDVLLWMCKREEKITAFLVASENNTTERTRFPDEWKRLLWLLLPLKRLNLAMESSGCALWELIPIVNGIVDGWKKIVHRFSDE